MKLPPLLPALALLARLASGAPPAVAGVAPLSSLDGRSDPPDGSVRADESFDAAPPPAAAGLAPLRSLQANQPAVTVEEEASFAIDVETYEKVMALRNQTIPFRCYVAVAYSLVLWCDITVPRELNVTAEIRDSDCNDFVEPAESAFFQGGIASPLFYPEITEAEKLQETFTHTYCARMDVMFRSAIGDVSLMDRRFPMEITYNYREQEGKEELQSAELEDAQTVAEEGRREVQIGLGVMGGVIVTMALVAIFWGKKKRSGREWRQREAQREEQRHLEDNAVEIAPLGSPEREAEENAII